MTHTKDSDQGRGLREKSCQNICPSVACAYQHCTNSFLLLSLVHPIHRLTSAPHLLPASWVVPIPCGGVFPHPALSATGCPLPCSLPSHSTSAPTPTDCLDLVTPKPTGSAPPADFLKPSLPSYTRHTRTSSSSTFSLGLGSMIMISIALINSLYLCFGHTTRQKKTPQTVRTKLSTLSNTHPDDVRCQGQSHTAQLTAFTRTHQVHVALYTPHIPATCL